MFGFRHLCTVLIALMTAQWKLDQQYADIMSDHPFGVALYRPLSDSVLKPGSVGYFDDYGSWNPICDISDHESLNRKRLVAPAEDLERAPIDNGITWGPMLSSNTKSSKVELSAGIDPATGIPVTVSAVYSYSIEKNTGAILLTSPPITHDHYYHTTPFKKWCKVNAITLLRQWPEVKRHGLWVVTSTYATKKCAINMWTTRGRGFKVGFDAEAMGIGKVGPSGEWHRSKTDEGWGEYSSEGSTKLVVFFGGIRFNYTWMMGKDLKPTYGGGQLRVPVTEQIPSTEQGTTMLLDEENEVGGEILAVLPDPDNNGSNILLECEEYID